MTVLFYATLTARGSLCPRENNAAVYLVLKGPSHLSTRGWRHARSLCRLLICHLHAANASTATFSNGIFFASGLEFSDHYPSSISLPGMWDSRYSSSTHSISRIPLTFPLGVVFQFKSTNHYSAGRCSPLVWHSLLVNEDFDDKWVTSLRSRVTHSWQSTRYLDGQRMSPSARVIADSSDEARVACCPLMLRSSTVFLAYSSSVLFGHARHEAIWSRVAWIPRPFSLFSSTLLRIQTTNVSAAIDSWLDLRCGLIGVGFTSSYFAFKFRHWKSSQNKINKLQARNALPKNWLRRVGLEATMSINVTASVISTFYLKGITRTVSLDRTGIANFASH